MINWFGNADISLSSIKSCGAKLKSAASANTVAPSHVQNSWACWVGVPGWEGEKLPCCKAGHGVPWLVFPWACRAICFWHDLENQRGTNWKLERLLVNSELLHGHPCQQHTSDYCHSWGLKMQIIWSVSCDYYLY